MTKEAKPVEVKPIAPEDIRAAVTLSGPDGKAVTGEPVGEIVVSRSGKRVIPIQHILQELRNAHPDATFRFSVKNVVIKKSKTS